jgi:hypothetical protein
MYKTLLFTLLFTSSLHAQTTSSFEQTPFGAADYLDNAGVSGQWADGNIALVNQYDAMFMAWQGWALSKVTDNTTQGFGNQYSVIAGKGAVNSTAYAVGYAFEPIIIRLTGSAKGKAVQGLYLNNNTYSYFSMRDGDAFSKRFGGASGADPDYFLLTVKKWINGQLGADSINFYLADYRSPNSSQDYLVKDWTFVNLSSLGDLDSLQFALTSTDVGAFGMNTPAFFCMDQLTTLDGTIATFEPNTNQKLEIRPNLAHDFIQIDQKYAGSLIEIYTSQGQLVLRDIASFSGMIPLTWHQLGMHVIKVGDGQGVFMKY